MVSHQLKDKQGHVLATIKTISSTREELRDAMVYLKGYYNPQSNETRDAHGHLVGKGNLLAMLLS